MQIEWISWEDLIGSDKMRVNLLILKFDWWNFW